MIDRLGRLLRSFVADEDLTWSGGDPDLADAWEELNGYLDDKEPFHRPPPATAPPSAVDEAYGVLELSPGASMEAVRASYKRLLRKYHPDRFVGKPEKQRAATEVTRAIIAAYRTIRRQKE